MLWHPRAAPFVGSLTGVIGPKTVRVATSEGGFLLRTRKGRLGLLVYSAQVSLRGSAHRATPGSEHACHTRIGGADPPADPAMLAVVCVFCCLIFGMAKRNGGRRPTKEEATGRGRDSGSFHATPTVCNASSGWRRVNGVFACGRSPAQVAGKQQQNSHRDGTDQGGGP